MAIALLMELRTEEQAIAIIELNYLLGNTPLHLCCTNDHHNKDDKIEKIFLLLSYGADILLENDKGKRPFQLMQTNQKEELGIIQYSF